MVPAASAQSAKPMTERELDKFIADWPAVEKWLQGKGKSFDSSAAAALSSAFFGADFTAFLRGKGWAEDRFYLTLGTASSLFFYAAVEKENPEMLKEFDDAIAEIRANPDITAAEKAEAIKSLEAVKKTILSLPAELEINEAELQLVRNRYEAFKKLFDAD